MRTIARAALAAAVLAGAAATAEAAPVTPSVGQHARVMNSIRSAQRRNNAAISRVQGNIRRQSGY